MHILIFQFHSNNCLRRTARQNGAQSVCKDITDMIKINAFAFFSFLLFLSIWIWKTGVDNLSSFSYYSDNWGVTLLIFIYVFFLIRLFLEGESKKRKYIKLLPVVMITYLPIIAALIFNVKIL